MDGKTEASRPAPNRASVLSISRAAILLPVRDSAARRAIRDSGVLRMLCGREVVIWGDVLDHVLGPMAGNE